MKSKASRLSARKNRKSSALYNKIREKTARSYAIHDGFKNMARHPFSVLASVTTMTIMLFLIALFLLFAVNANYLIGAASQEPPVEIRFKRGATLEEARALAQYLGDDLNVIDHRLMTPADNFREFKDKMGDSDLFEGFDYEQFIPYTIRLRLDNPGKGVHFREEMMGMRGVSEVVMEENLMNLLTTALQKIGIIVGICFAVLASITVFIINNMVRLSALARSDEISIMKYLGATDAYIKIPFSVEGLIVGTLSALLSGGIAMIIYRFLSSSIGAHIGETGSLSLLSTGRLLPLVFGTCLGIGLLLGVLTTSFAVKKYVRV